MNNFEIISVEIVKDQKNPYLKYVILDENKIRHIFRVSSLKQLHYILNELQIKKS